MRHCDDIADGPGTTEEKRNQLAVWRGTLESTLCGEAGAATFLPALQDTVRRFSIPPQYFHWMIDGVEMDLTVDHYQTFEDLYHYCFKVASSVGLVCLQIFGYSDEQARKYAEYCGIAFQLTNILRDIREDACMGRTYLPVEDLEKFSYSAQELKHGIVDGRFRRLMAYESSRALKYYSGAWSLIPLIESAARPALWAMMEIYHRVLQKIARKQFDVFGSTIRLSSPEKASIALKALMMRVLPWGYPTR
jgi:phytoene synthase